jgi:hypothetical protein
MARAHWAVRKVRAGLEMAGVASGRAIVFVACAKDTSKVSDAIRAAAAVSGLKADVRSYNGRMENSAKNYAHNW